MTAYYNEIEPYAAQWLRNLIAGGHIAAGDVDERSIEDVRPDDLRGYTQCHFFAGVGGWSIALRLANWPDDRPIWTGSCPCQPYSEAGQRKGKADPRHLWPAWFRLIRELRPDCIFGEQVPEAIGLGWLDEVAADLEAEEYAIGTAVLSACLVEARQERERLWFVARANGFTPKWSPKPRVECHSWPVEPDLPRVANGIPEQPFFRRAYGNAIIPIAGAEFIVTASEAMTSMSNTLDQGPCVNTDREIWREREGDAYAPSIHVTKDGGVGINCGGMVHVKPIREWHTLAERDIDRHHLADLLLCYGEFGTTEGASNEGALRCADAIISWRPKRSPRK
jgi:DNA (cytosine-5)-methyltransferase 1